MLRSLDKHSHILMQEMRVVTWRMLKSTTSSAEGSVASNLHCVMASAVAIMTSFSPDLAFPVRPHQTLADMPRFVEA